MVNLATTELLIVLTILAPYFTVKVIYKPLKIKQTAVTGKPAIITAHLAQNLQVVAK